MNSLLEAHKKLLGLGYPVETIRLDGEVISVVLSSSATPEDYIAAQAALENAITAQQTYEAAIAAGYLVEPEGFTLAISDADRSEWTQMSNLLRELLEQGLINGETEQVILDKDGQPHTVTVTRLRQILAYLGLYYITVWSAYRS